ncbi:MAG: hypothetical protein M0P14_00785 [Alkaliphilus sp.]|nr:hypothetical protein [Alkaliphilus sp.]
MAAKAVKTIVLKKGRVLMARSGKARVFTSKGNAVKFTDNLRKVSKDLKVRDFEFITFA